jgi:hypothetical protein
MKAKEIPGGQSMKIKDLALSLVILSAVAAAADKSNTSAVDAKAAFEQLKTLAGEWQAESQHGRSQVTYEVIANGSVLVERDVMPGHGEMITTYHLDGDQLVLTHYCTAGNQPHMVAERYDRGNGQLDFGFVSAGNLRPGAGHMHNARFHLLSANRFEAAWDFVESDKLKFTEDLHFTRVK